MTNDQINGLLLILVGLYAAIRFRYNGTTSLYYGKKFERLFTFKKDQEKTSKSEEVISQIMYLVLGIIFVFIGISKL